MVRNAKTKSYFSSSSCRLPHTARKTISAVPAVGCHTLRAKLFQQWQAAKHCAQSYFSTGRLPNTARKAISAVPTVGCQTLRATISAVAGCQPLRAKLFQLWQSAKHCAQSYFSTSSCRLPNTARKAISAAAG